MVRKDFIWPIAILTIICLVASSGLSLVNGLTAPMIDLADAERQMLAMNAILPTATGFEEIDDVELPRTVREAFRSENGVGYIVVVSVNGYNGEIRVLCGIDADGKIISAKTLSHSETKGFGDFLDQDWYTGQFDGKDSRLEGISTVTGATISSTAFMNAIREALAAFELIRGV